jgi:hypothetical protein
MEMTKKASENSFETEYIKYFRGEIEKIREKQISGK